MNTHMTCLYAYWNQLEYEQNALNSGTRTQFMIATSRTFLLDGMQLFYIGSAGILSSIINAARTEQNCLFCGKSKCRRTNEGMHVAPTVPSVQQGFALLILFIYGIATNTKRSISTAWHDRTFLVGETLKGNLISHHLHYLRRPHMHCLRIWSHTRLSLYYLDSLCQWLNDE